MRSTRAILAAGLVALGTACANPGPSAPSPSSAPAADAVVQPAATASGRVTGTVQRVSNAEVILQDGKQFTLSPEVVIIRSTPVDSRAFQPGDFIAVTAKRQPDNTLLASVVNIFPESMRGLGVGQRPMDAGNLMTNATIDDVAGNLMTTALDGAPTESFTVSFPGGSDQVRLADDAKVNQFQPADVADITPGTTITASVRNGAAQFITIM